MDKPHIAFLGIGLMGTPMVEHLLTAGYPMTLWNRTRSKTDTFKQRASVADTPEQALKNADVVISMLENGPVVDYVLYQSGAITHARQGTLVIDMSSIAPELARQHAERCHTLGLRYVDAPVSGGTVGAERASLSIMAGAEEPTLEQVMPILACLGNVTHIGPPGTGQVAKLANQAIVGITIGAVSEALLLAARSGADPSAVRKALMGGFAGSRILELHGQRMINRDFEPGGRARIQLKDLRMVLDEARNQTLTLPLSQRVYEEYLALCAHGHADVDHSGLLLELESLNNTRMS